MSFLCSSELSLRFYALIFSHIPHRYQKSRRTESKKLESRGSFLEAAICPPCDKDLATGETKAVAKTGLTVVGVTMETKKV